MLRLHRIAPSLFCLTGLLTPVQAADLGGPVYRERDVVIERPAPPVVRERIIERHYYYDAAPRAPRTVYVPTYDVDEARRYDGFAPDDGYRWWHRRAFFFDRSHGWHRHHRPWRD
jgi:hypothetical protein